ncbi:uncharacterized protein TNIN_160431 [Trichonephila inaurata madagascariensis]|uniref:Uncharacterized protein n=1 Tax=Trichonephila inaurata madagascariensis TaxID=2747483 RepID=A0A8X6X9L8_9ARAC|nr:uncharacterized protein TNIN_160431 [Trichonephila inaurata madagascariensis]
MMYFDDFMSFPAFILVLCNLAALFWSAYSLVFSIGTDYLISACIFFGVVHYGILLLMILLSAAIANEAAMLAQDTAVSVPAWFRQNYRELKMMMRRKFKRKISLTLWKIYVIDKRLLISAFGNLVTYGILLGTLGSLQFSRTENLVS